VILAIGLLPVLVFLAALIYLDSYKLVKPKWVVVAIVIGCALASLCWFINVRLKQALGIDLSLYSRYVAPIVEETAKGLAVIAFVRSNRIGFLVDAAIYGFAIGAGFALVESVVYWNELSTHTLSLWVVRGFGTAVMHGGATAICAMVGKALEERGRTAAIWGWPFAILVAAVIHSFFNHFFVSPVLSTALILLILPPLAFGIFQRSERALEQWLNVGFDADTEVLEVIMNGKVSESPVGAYLRSLKEHFSGEVVVDMLNYLRLHLELSLRAKGLLMMREAGFQATLAAADRAKLDELDFLEKSIGATGKLAMAPFLRKSKRDLWQIYMMRGEVSK
jgi:protease PrsW